MTVRILVAEDSATMREIVRMTFAAEDAEVTLVDSGDAALDQLRSAPPDVIIADGAMPGVNGYELARVVKHDVSLKQTGVIVLASEQNPFDAQKAAEHGVDAHVLKPFETQSLIDTVAQVVGGAKAAASAPAPMNPKMTMRGMSAPSSIPAATSTPEIAADTFERAGDTRPPSAPAPSQRPSDPVLEIVDDASLPPGPTSGVMPSVHARAADFEDRLHGLGLTPEQVSGVLAISKEVVEQVVWEVVPDLAETLIREEIRRLTAE